MKSTHIPGFAGGVVSVTGAATFDPELDGRKIQAVTANLKTAVAANEESDVTCDWDDTTGKITLTVTKGGANHGTAGDSAVDVSWMAFVE